MAVILSLAAALGLAADPNLVRLAMPDARILAGVDVIKTRNSPFGSFVISQIPASGQQDLQKLTDLTGFDPLQHLTEILVAAPGAAGTERRLVAASGAFDVDRIVSAAKAQGGQVESYRGATLLAGPGGTSHGAAFALLNRSTVLAGDTDSVRQAIDRSQGGGPGPLLNAALAARVSSVSTANDAWFVSAVPLAEMAGSLPAPAAGGALQGDALKSIEMISGGARFTNVVAVTVEALTASAQDATSLAEGLKFLTGLVRLNPNTPHAALLNTLDISAGGNSLKLSLSIPEDQVEEAIRGSIRPRRERLPRQ